MNKIFLLTAFLVSLSIFSLAADPALEERQTLYGTVTEVTDTETMEVRIEWKNGEELNQTVHVNGINGPFDSEPEYGKAKEFTKNLALHKRVKLITRGLDAYQRLLAFVYVDEISLGFELLKHGLARIHSVQMGPDPKLYDEYKYAQLEALFQKKGVWSDKK